MAVSLPLTAQDGFAGVAPLSGLAPATRYYYALTLGETAPDPSLGPYAQFATFPPSESPLPFNFALGSCFRPETADSGGIFRLIDQQRLKDNLRFILLIGDQIYADAYQYNGIGKIACTLDEYRKVYEYTWSRPPFRELLYNLPAFMTLDDHEVDDDWTWTDFSRELARLPIWDRVERFLKRRGLRNCLRLGIPGRKRSSGRRQDHGQ